MNFWSKLIALPALLSLVACETSKPHYISAACPPQWEIPANLAEAPQAPAALAELTQRLQDLTQRLTAQSKPVSTTQPSSPAFSTSPQRQPHE